jgi:hypothetical protein
MIPQPLPTRKTARRCDIGWKVRKIRTDTKLRGPISYSPCAYFDVDCGYCGDAR